MGLLALVATGLPIYLAVVESRRDPSAGLAPADRLRHLLLDSALEQPGDPYLEALYKSFNSKHFGDDLPPIPVRWEPRMAEVDRVEGGPATMKGMFGTKGDRAIILLSPSVQDDAAELNRALAHEMVHAYMFKMGEDTTDHGPAFQSVLRRLAIEGALGNATRSDDRAELGRWIAQERTRLNEETVAFNANPTSERLQRIQADQARLQQEIERYNAMTPFPDGFAGTRSTSR